MNELWQSELPLNLVQITVNPQHKRIFTEIFLTLEGALKDLNVPYQKSENALKADCLNILIGGTCFLPSEFSTFIAHKRYIVYQFEPLALDVGVLSRNLQYLNVLRNAEVIWDYSKSNIDFLEQHGIKRVIHVPLHYHADLTKLNHSVTQDIDVLFCGWLTPRRLKIIQSLKDQGLRVETPFGTYGSERDALIARAKIQLNMHQEDNLAILEEARLFYLLSNGCFVISEESDHNPYGTGVVFCKYEEIVITCLQYLKEAGSTRDEIAKMGQAFFSEQKMTYVLTHALIQTQALLRNPEQERIKQIFPRHAYYEQTRHDIAELIPTDAKTLLDIGCGSGQLGRFLKTRQDCHITGIEQEQLIAYQAATALDLVYCGDALVQLDKFPNAQFDVIILADILEHIADTDSVLQKIHSKLKQEGKLIISIPNVRHESIVNNLFQGNWQYQTEGILDRTHLRFFTLKSLVRTLINHDFFIEQTQAHCLNFAKNIPNGYSLENLPGNFLDEMQHYQYLLVCHIDRTKCFSFDGTPLTIRSRLYQAEYYLEIGMTQMAFELFQRIADSNYLGQEAYLAYIETARLGEKHSFLSKIDIIAYYLKAYEVMPTNTDTLYNLARLFRHQQAHHLAHLYASQAISLIRAKINSFNETSRYDWRILDEYAIASYWIGAYAESEKFNSLLLAGVNLPETELARIQDNLHWAVTKSIQK